jgi:hypothetical protein
VRDISNSAGWTGGGERTRGPLLPGHWQCEWLGGKGGAAVALCSWRGFGREAGIRCDGLADASDALSLCHKVQHCFFKKVQIKVTK